MKTGTLLDELINIAEIPKTEFALCMNMTPSGLSKILTGKRLPSLKEKKEFSKGAALSLSEKIYGHACHMKLDRLFPVIYDFRSRRELELFLAYAIDYALENDFAAANNESRDYLEREASFLGKRPILNMFCVILSDHIRSSGDEPLEFFSTLPVMSEEYSDIFPRVAAASRNDNRPSFNHYFDLSAAESHYDGCNMGLLSLLAEAHRHVDLNLWEFSGDMGLPFLLLKGQVLLLFSLQINGTPLMTCISHKSYLPSFYNSLIKKGAKKISFNSNEVLADLENDPLLVNRLINSRGIDAVYDFMPLGYLVAEKEVEKTRCDEKIKDMIMKFFKSVMAEDTAFFITLDAMTEFFTTGKAVVPLAGTVDIPAEERVSHLRRLNPYIDEFSARKIRVVNREMPRLAVLRAQGLSVVYLMCGDYTFEKFHVFETDMINNILERDVAQNSSKMVEFSFELWEAYLTRLSKIS